MKEHQDITFAVNQLKKGDNAYFDVVYEATKTKVYYTILTIIKDPSLSEDIMQDVYLKALKSIKKYKPTKPFVAWIVTIARNEALNHYNRRKKELLLDNDTVPDDFFGSVNDHSEDNYYLNNLLKVLNETERDVIVRFVILEETHKTIAKALNKPIGTITWTYQNALKKLRKEAGEDNV